MLLLLRPVPESPTGFPFVEADLDLWLEAEARTDNPYDAAQWYVDALRERRVCPPALAEVVSLTRPWG